MFWMFALGHLRPMRLVLPPGHVRFAPKAIFQIWKGDLSRWATCRHWQIRSSVRISLARKLAILAQLHLAPKHRCATNARELCG